MLNTKHKNKAEKLKPTNVIKTAKILSRRNAKNTLFSTLSLSLSLTLTLLLDEINVDPSTLCGTHF
jgi:hypothetical protein